MLKKSSGFDDGLLTDKPCKAPCWNGLVPGQATSQDVDLFIQGLSTTEWPSRHTSVEKTGCKEVLIADKPFASAHAVVKFHIENGKLTYLQLFHDYMPLLQQIVDHLGPPEYVEAVNVIGPDGHFYALDIYYPKLGVAFKVFVHENDMGFIKPGMVVSDIQYFEPGDLLNYFLARYACFDGRDGAEKFAQDEIANYIQPWPGFGPVNVVDEK